MKRIASFVILFCLFSLGFEGYSHPNIEEGINNVPTSINVSDVWIKSEDDLYRWRIPYEYRGIIFNLREQFDIPVKYIYRMCYIESKFEKNAIRYENNGTYSVGMLQINSSNFDYFSDKFNEGESFDPFDPYMNLYIGVSYMKYLNDKLERDWIKTFAAYQWGIGNVLRGREFPDMVRDYSSTIYFGKSYIGNVVVLKGAVGGIV